jgi:hypothetical protein
MLPNLFLGWVLIEPFTKDYYIEKNVTPTWVLGVKHFGIEFDTKCPFRSKVHKYLSIRVLKG